MDDESEKNLDFRVVVRENTSLEHHHNQSAQIPQRWTPSF
jgi:hypothetical protein